MCPYDQKIVRTISAFVNYYSSLAFRSLGAMTVLVPCELDIRPI